MKSKPRFVKTSNVFLDLVRVAFVLELPRLDNTQHQEKAHHWRPFEKPFIVVAYRKASSNFSNCLSLKKVRKLFLCYMASLHCRVCIAESTLWNLPRFEDSR